MAVFARLGLLLLFASLAISLHAKADDDGVIGQFFSIFKDPPQIRLPHLDITPFWTNDLKIGRDAYARGDYERARGAFLRASDDGNVVADWYLGHMYRLGKGVPVDAATAYSYFRRVADTFDPEERDPYRLRITVDAQIRVADYLRLGIPATNLRANPDAAARIYLRMATNYGHPRAMYGLGVMSVEGAGMRKNPQQGLKWLSAAARKHSPEAAAYLGNLYSQGEIVPQDDTRALSWYIIAAGSAQKDDNPEIFARLTELRFSATEETRIEAEAHARVWNEQNPGGDGQ
jgi:TPR repeat protein